MNNSGIAVFIERFLLPMFKKESLLFVLLGGFFVTNALIAEFIGAKLFSLEKTLGMASVPMHFFGVDVSGFDLTAGVLLWPFVFVMTDLINEYYGPRGVKLLSWLTSGLIIYAYLMVFVAIKVAPSDFWLKTNSAITPSIDVAFGQIFGQGLWIIAGSLVAFLVGQALDIWVFQWLRARTGERHIWLRATGSTLFSQLIDSFVVLWIAFYLGANWPLPLVLAVGLRNYLFKIVAAIALTPVLYGVHWAIDRYLGLARAHEMFVHAAADDNKIINEAN